MLSKFNDLVVFPAVPEHSHNILQFVWDLGTLSISYAYNGFPQG